MTGKQGGFSLIELMIASTLALLLLALMLTAFSSLSAASTQSRQLAFLQQNGQLVLNLLYNEFENSGFWAGQSLAQVRQSSSQAAPPAADCRLPGMTHGSFPLTNEPFLTLYAAAAGSSGQLSCLSNLANGTEFIQLKRTLGLAVTPDEMRANRYYFWPQWQQAQFVDRDSAIPAQTLLFPYQHLVLYIQWQQHSTGSVPVLMRKRLVRTAGGQASISTDSVVDGVERLHFEFLLDLDQDGQPDAIVPTADMTSGNWFQQDARILGVRFFVLLRALEPDMRYQNQRLYQLGSQQFAAPGDHYRRLLLSGAVNFSFASTAEE